MKATRNNDIDTHRNTPLVGVDAEPTDPLTRHNLPTPLLLGSASYTRKLILSEMGVPYVQLVRPINERDIGDRGGGADPRELVLTLAHAKLDHLINEISQGKCMDELPPSSSSSSISSDDNNHKAGRVVLEGWVLLTADQVVTHNGQILEKPDTIEEAREFISRFADGSPVSTHGACVLAHYPSGHRVSGVDTASVYFRPTMASSSSHRPTLIDRLIEEGAPILECAGGLMIEHTLVREHVVRMDGTEDSIMGLSKDLVERLMCELKTKLEG